MPFDAAKTSNTEIFGRFHRGLTERGIYWPPSQFEAWFVSLAHTRADLEAAAARASAPAAAPAVAWSPSLGRGSTRAYSSIGQSSGLIIRWLQVRVLLGPPLSHPTHPRQCSAAATRSAASAIACRGTFFSRPMGILARRQRNQGFVQ